jgi:hypothetical protein
MALDMGFELIGFQRWRVCKTGGRRVEGVRGEVDRGSRFFNIVGDVVEAGPNPSKAAPDGVYPRVLVTAIGLAV